MRPVLSSWSKVVEDGSHRPSTRGSGMVADRTLARRDLMTQPSAPPESHLRDDCAREVFAVAEVLRRTGRQRRLRDVTIVLPIDFTAVEAVELACLALAEGELSESAAAL